MFFGHTSMWSQKSRPQRPIFLGGGNKIVIGSLFSAYFFHFSNRPVRNRAPCSRGSVIQLFHKVLLHNLIFSETSYTFHAFTGFPGSSIMPIFKQSLIKDAVPATSIEIATYIATLGISSTPTNGRYANGELEVWDLLPRNVLKDCEGDIFVIDAEIKLL